MMYEALNERRLDFLGNNQCIIPPCVCLDVDDYLDVFFAMLTPHCCYRPVHRNTFLKIVPLRLQGRPAQVPQFTRMSMQN